MTTQTADPPVLGRIELLPGPQSDFVFSQARFPSLFSGVGGGKTFASVVKAFQYCGEHPGARGCLTAPTYRTVEDVTLTTFFDVFEAGFGSLWTFKKNEMAIDFSNGSKILLRPAEDPDKLRGLNLAFFGMDEAAIGFQHEAFKVLQARLRQPGYPHQGWITTTPKGIRSWLYQRWVKRELDGVQLPEYYVRFRASTEANPYLEGEFLESLRASYGNTRFAAQELEGEFVAFEGQAFPDFDEKIHVAHPPVGINYKRRVAGLDFGRGAPMAVVEVCQDYSNHLWVIREIYQRGMNYDDLLWALTGEKQGVKKDEPFPDRVFCDPTAKDTIDFLRKSHVGARKAKSNSFVLRESLVGARLAIGPTGPGMFISPACPNLIEELASLAYAKNHKSAETSDKRWEPGLPDHAYDALAYALMELDAGARGRPQPSAILRKWGHN